MYIEHWIWKVPRVDITTTNSMAETLITNTRTFYKKAFTIVFIRETNHRNSACTVANEYYKVETVTEVR